MSVIDDVPVVKLTGGTQPNRESPLIANEVSHCGSQGGLLADVSGQESQSHPGFSNIQMGERRRIKIRVTNSNSSTKLSEESVQFNYCRNGVGRINQQDRSWFRMNSLSSCIQNPE